MLKEMLYILYKIVYDTYNGIHIHTYISIFIMKIFSLFVFNVNIYVCM